MLPQALAFASLACTAADPDAEGFGSSVPGVDPLPSNLPIETGGNLLVILLDDVGIDKVGAYGLQVDTPATPSLDALAAEGVLFENAWANPSCSPTRAALLTGRHASRTGIGHWVDPVDDTFSLQASETTLPEVLREHGYQSALAGKWHLVTWQDEDPARHALDAGFDLHRGSLGNPQMGFTDTSAARGYYNWEKATDGELAYEQSYMSSDTTDEALASIEALEPPWFVEVSYNAAHEPLHVPPRELHGWTLSAESIDADFFDAAVEALDTEIGRLLDGLDDEVRATTTIVVLGDNGTPGFGIRDPLDPEQGKGTVSEGGVRIPLLVAGPHVQHPGTSSDALVHALDVFATGAHLAGAELSGRTVQGGEHAGLPLVHDSRSLLDHVLAPGKVARRDALYTERFKPNGPGPYKLHQRVVRDDDGWRLVRKGPGETVNEELYRFEGDGFHVGHDLLSAPLDQDAVAALARLRTELDQRDTELTFGR